MNQAIASVIIESVIEQLSAEIANNNQLTSSERLRLRAAKMCLQGDLNAASNAIAASMIPQADWDAVKRGDFEY